MKYALDIAIVVVVVLFAAIGAKKGFIKACIDFVGAFVSMIAAGILSLPVAEWVYETFFHDALLEKISQAVTGMNAADAVHAVFAGFPDVLLRGLGALGITESGVMEQVETGAMGIAEGITAQISPMLIGFVRIFALLVLFILFIVVLRAVAALLTGVCHLPVLRKLTGFFGTVFGILLAVVTIWVVLACVHAILPLLSAEMQLKMAELTTDSIVWNFLYDFNPAYSLIQ